MARLRKKGKLKAEEERPDEVIKTNVNEIKVEEPRMVGPVSVAEEYWKRIGMTEALKACEMSNPLTNRTFVKGKQEIERAKCMIMRSSSTRHRRMRRRIGGKVLTFFLYCECPF